MADLETTLATLAKPWTAKADRLVSDRVADVRSHAWHALTGQVVSAPDGRRTIAAARQTRSMASALARLAELRSGLAGPSVSSLDGLIRDARAAFYRDAWLLWADQVPPELRIDGAGPTQAGERAARGIAVHGRELYGEVSGPIYAAARNLNAAVALAGTRDATDEQARDTLDAWRTRAELTLRRTARMLISDSQVAIYWGVGRSMIRPEYLDES